MTATALAELARAAGPDQGRPDEPDWLRDARAHAADYLSEHGFPTRREEDWRYTRLDALLDQSFVPAVDDAQQRRAAVAELLVGVPDLGGQRLVFVDGAYDAEASRTGGSADGVHVTDLATAIAGDPAMAEVLLRGDEPSDGFAALNTALADAGVVVRIDAGVECADPIQVVHVLSGHGDPVAANLRSVIDLAEGATATVATSTLGADAATGLLNTSTRVRLGDDAMLTHFGVQDQPEGAFHLEALAITQGARSRFVGHVSSIGAAVARHEVHVRQVGRDAVTELDGIYVPSGSQQHDHPILIEHLAAGGTSRQSYRGVIDDHAHGVFNGRIIVHQGAEGIDADQSNRNLLLSDHAEADTRPRLEIYADDVKCTHGAAVGRLDDDALFYLRTRGIGVAEARRVLTFAFVEELVGRLGEGPLHDQVEALVSSRLHPDPARRNDLGAST